MALSKNRIKYIHSLELKKNRDAAGVFLAEGPKVVSELLGHFPCQLLAATSGWQPPCTGMQAEESIEVTTEELTRASLLRTPQQVLAIFRKRKDIDNKTEIFRSLCLALDGVQDPGNLGTIIRLADWFGIRHIFCSPDTADVYSPKAVQATMGSLARVHVHVADLPSLIRDLPEGTPIYGTFLDGENMYEKTLSNNGLLIMGNEGRGIRDEVRELVNQRLFIPAYPEERGASESLNVGVATAIVCAEFRRQASSH
ncbi:MAG: RNA methyltransferase [Candidatus Bacteroides intestinipullorum]|uniref:RNA methyltransferase n=1 Tax=Candidatus Bacteroides intestinipullorum TaxID=2838471 RepID=A0A9E2KF39_9BACE|nr:RNA methyltransferase [Candidatus Bacteroides intestinipullorum]